MFIGTGQKVSSQRTPTLVGLDYRVSQGLQKVVDPAQTASDSSRLPPEWLLAPQSSQAVWAGESRPVSELAAEEAVLSLPYGKGKLVSKDIKGEPAEARQWDFWSGLEVNEKNDRNREIIRKQDPDAKGTPDEALAWIGGKSRGRTIVPNVMPAPYQNFETISLTDTTALPGQGFLPPDINGEVGPSHFVETVNSAFRIYNKTGTPQIALTSLGTLFGTVPGPCAGNEDGDPIVLYDQLADRWVISEFCTVANPNNHQLIAVSKTNDPTGAYWLYDFDDAQQQVQRLTALWRVAGRVLHDGQPIQPGRDAVSRCGRLRPSTTAR